MAHGKVFLIGPPDLFGDLRGVKEPHPAFGKTDQGPVELKLQHLPQREIADLELGGHRMPFEKGRTSVCDDCLPLALASCDRPALTAEDAEHLKRL